MNFPVAFLCGEKPVSGMAFSVFVPDFTLLLLCEIRYLSMGEVDKAGQQLY